MDALESWDGHYRDEQDAAFLYRAIARAERDPARRQIFERLAAVEDRHIERWVELFREHGRAVPPHRPSRKARALAALARRFGSSSVLPLVLAEEGREVQAHQIEMERHELKLMPDLEEDELAVMYEAKGLTPERARETARAVMRDPVQALEAQVREELGIQPAELAPLKDGIVTGAATAVGAFIPIAPFLMLDRGPAVWVSLTVSMAAHFAIGAARSLFTGRSLWASGRDMFLVGFGVAAVGYGIGELIVRFF